MKYNIFRYLFLSVSLIVFGLTVVWLIMHFQQPNLRNTNLTRNYEDLIVQMQSNKSLELKNIQANFVVREGETVYIKSLKGDKINPFIRTGKVSIMNQADEVMYEYNILDDITMQQITLPAGEYRMVEEITVNEEAILNYELPEEEEKDLEYNFQVWQF